MLLISIGTEEFYFLAERCSIKTFKITGTVFSVLLPIIAFLGLNNTLVTGGVVFSILLIIPVFFIARKGFVLLRDKYFVIIKESKFVKFIKKLPLVKKAVQLVGKARTMY